jgi:hypothetical protein
VVSSAKKSSDHDSSKRCDCGSTSTYDLCADDGDGTNKSSHL